MRKTLIFAAALAVGLGASAANAMSSTSPAGLRAATDALGNAALVHCRPYRHWHPWGYGTGCHGGGVSVEIERHHRGGVGVEERERSHRGTVGVEERERSSIRSRTTTHGETSVRGSTSTKTETKSGSSTTGEGTTKSRTNTGGSAGGSIGGGTSGSSGGTSGGQSGQKQ
jgi:hypothetical protein